MEFTTGGGPMTAREALGFLVALSRREVVTFEEPLAYLEDEEIIEIAERIKAHRAAIARATGPHADLDTIDLAHDLGTRDLTSPFGEEN